MNTKENSADPLNSVWKFFVSVRLTIVLLLSIAITSIIGTIIPQNERPADYVQVFGEFGYQFFERLGILDMYHSWWFQALLLMLTLNVVVCSVERLSTMWRVIFAKNPSVNIDGFRRRKNRQEFTTNLAPDQLKPLFEPLIAKRFGYSRTEATDTGFYLYAEKWRWTRLGVYIVHLSVLLLLVGGLIGSIFGFEGFVNIPEGESVNQIRLRNSNQSYPLNFEIRCDDFDVTFYDNNMPKEFRSSLTILEGGKPVVKKDIIVNDPLRYKGISFFQSSYGKLGPQAQTVKIPPEITITFTLKQTGKIHTIKAKIGEPIAIPEGLGKFTITELKKSHSFRGQDLGDTLMGLLSQNDGVDIEVALPLRFPSFDRMGPMFDKRRRDDLFISVTGLEIPGQVAETRYYTGLQVTRDPGVWVVYSGFILMIIGCYVTFFMSHQRIVVDISRRGATSNVLVVGTSVKNKLAMQRKVKNMADILSNST
jgi:cytochrome c biogenesis protein